MGKLAKVMARPYEEREQQGLEQARAHLPVKPQVKAPEPSLSPLEKLARSAGNRGMSSTIARSSAGIGPGGEVHPVVQGTIASRRGGGSSLDPDVAGDLGKKLNTDLSDVRVHNDDTSDQLARSVQARAFATGNDIYFAKGEYDPSSAAGRKLLAHEAVHTVQQRGAPSSPLRVSQPGDAQETEADRVADGL